MLLALVPRLVGPVPAQVEIVLGAVENVNSKNAEEEEQMMKMLTLMLMKEREHAHLLLWQVLMLIQPGDCAVKGEFLLLLN